MQALRRWQTGCIAGREVDHETNSRLRHKVAAADAKATYFQQAGQPRHGPNHHIAAAALEIDPVIADEQGGRNLAGTSGQDQVEYKPGLARPGGAADQHG
ncbi:MAG: hypothetical protein BGP05_05345 [Rhizobiales bacterium 62-47]|nr:MAG: hypothetical protein BGP05_05345 [Rhizobiales bacterium 62-47]